MTKHDARAAQVAPARSFLRKSLMLATASLALSAAALPAAASTWWSATPSLTIGSTTINVRNKGALGNGRHDDTAAIQAAVNALPSSGGTVYIPGGKYMVNPVKSIRLRSHTRLKLASTAQLAALPTSNSWSYVVKAWHVNNVEIVGGHIVGERAQHKGSSGEWGMGVSVLGSSKVFVHDTRLSDCWGDGLYIGDISYGGSRVPSTDVTVNRVVSTNNRRQGLSITPSKRVYVVNSTFSDTHGTLPQAGIDIEPQGKTSQVRLENNVMTGNRGNGLELHSYVSDLTVQKNTIKSNHGFGIYAGSPSYVTVGANLITRNGLAGVSLNHVTHDVAIRNNTINYNSTIYISPTVTGGNLSRDLKIVSTTRNITVSGNTYSK